MEHHFKWLRESTFPSINYEPRDSPIFEEIETDFYIIIKLASEFDRPIYEEKLERVRRYQNDPTYVPDISLHFALFDIAGDYPRKFLPKEYKPKPNSERDLFFQNFDDDGNIKGVTPLSCVPIKRDSYFNLIKTSGVEVTTKIQPDGTVKTIVRSIPSLNDLRPIQGTKEYKETPFVEMCKASVSTVTALIDIETAILIYPALVIADPTATIDLEKYAIETDFVSTIPSDNVVVFDAPPDFIPLFHIRHPNQQKTLINLPYFGKQTYDLLPSDITNTNCYLNFSLKNDVRGYAERLKKILRKGYICYYNWICKIQEYVNPGIILSSFVCDGVEGHLLEIGRNYVSCQLPIHDYINTDLDYHYIPLKYSHASSIANIVAGGMLYYDHNLGWSTWQTKDYSQNKKNKITTAIPNVYGLAASNVLLDDPSQYGRIWVKDGHVYYERPYFFEKGELEPLPDMQDCDFPAIIKGTSHIKQVYPLTVVWPSVFAFLPVIPPKWTSINSIKTDERIYIGFNPEFGDIVHVKFTLPERIAYASPIGFPMDVLFGSTCKWNPTIRGSAKAHILRWRRLLSQKYKWNAKDLFADEI